jgi:hypothetical protein
MFRAGDVDGQRKTCRDRGVFYIQHGHSCSAVPGPRLKKGARGGGFTFRKARKTRARRHIHVSGRSKNFRHEPRKLRGFVLFAGVGQDCGRTCAISAEREGDRETDTTALEAVARSGKRPIREPLKLKAVRAD